MVANKRRQPQGVAGDAKNISDEAQKNEVFDKLIRVGYLARGIVYGLIGYLAAQTIFAGQGKITDQKGALATIAAQPFGKVVLGVVVIGLIGLVFWGFIRAISDPYHKGSDTKGMITRIGYAISGISYAALLFPAINLLSGSGKGGGSSTQGAQQAASGIINKPWGPWLIGLIGLILIGVGVFRIYSGYKGKLNERLNSYKMNAEQRKWAIRLGRIGYIALGIVFVIIGLLAVYGAVSHNVAKLGGLDSALLFLSRQSYGPWLLAVVALGLIAYAVYSIMGAMWFRIKEL